MKNELIKTYPILQFLAIFKRWCQTANSTRL